MPHAKLVGMRAVLFDMDGTLIDTEPLWGVATFDISERMGHRLTPEQRNGTVGGTSEDTIATCLRLAGIDPTSDQIAHWKALFFDHVASLMDEGFDFRPGFPQLLQTIHAAGIPQVLVTNTERVLVEHCLPALGPANFAATICGDEVPRGKPFPDPYLLACEAVGCSPDDALVVEDSTNGMRAAQAAGCRVLGVPCEPGQTIPEGVRTLESLYPGMTDLGEADVDFLREVWKRLGE